MAASLITLAQIRAAQPCTGGWKTLLEKTGQDPARINADLKLSIGDIALTNGADDALWATRCIDDRRAVVRAIIPSVKRAAAQTRDSRVHDCIAALDRWIAGDDNVDLARAAESARVAMAPVAGGLPARAALASARASAKSSCSVLWAAESEEAERERQATDIIEEFPLHFFKDHSNG